MVWPPPFSFSGRVLIKSIRPVTKPLPACCQKVEIISARDTRLVCAYSRAASAPFHVYDPVDHRSRPYDGAVDYLNAEQTRVRVTVGRGGILGPFQRPSRGQMGVATLQAHRYSVSGMRILQLASIRVIDESCAAGAFRQLSGMGTE
jgi:hypothetical protein